MTYEVLARKWRPHRFEDMVGQESVLRMLTNAFTQKRIHHAYLLSGTRGVGKTTLGRIIAKCLNCEKGITHLPCDDCYACKAIDAGQFIDLYEVDAASRTKVEDTRELLENVLYPPSQGRYKIYLIDEVHMLSNHSFNALLKTLEEPPAHVKFILATTEPKRLPITILSRCLQFHLKCISATQIANRLQYICQVENICYEEVALEKLAHAAEGSMRDALSLLDQAIAYSENAITMQDINSMLSSVAQDDILPLLKALAAHDSKELFSILDQLNERSPDYQQLLDDLLNLFHQIALIQLVPDYPIATDMLRALAQQFTPEDIQLYYQIALLGKRDLNLTANAAQGFTMLMLRMLAFKPMHAEKKTSNLIEIKTNPISTEQQTKYLDTAHSRGTAPNTTHSRPTAPNLPTATVLPNWRELLPQLNLTGMAHALAANCTLEKMQDNKIELALSITHQPMLNAKLKERIAEALSMHFKASIQLDIVITSAELVTPQKQQAKDAENRLIQAKQTIMEDSTVKQLIDLYDATVEVSLLS